jgi:hypothetical protein
MADSVIFMGWDRAVAGREKQAVQLFQKSMAYYSKLKKEGKIESFESFILTPHGGDLNGFTLIRGDAKKLAEIHDDPAAVELRLEANYCLSGFGSVSGYTGESLTKMFAQWAKLAGI